MEQLRFVLRKNSANRLELNHNAPFHHEIGVETADDHLPKEHVHRCLPIDMYPLVPQRPCERSLVHDLEKPMPEFVVDLEERDDNAPREPPM